MNIESMKASVILKASRGGLVVRKYSPEILLGVGIVGVIASAVVACKATLKVEAVMDEHYKKLEMVKYANNTVEKEAYSDTDYKKDLVITYIQTGVDLGKLYGPALLLGAASIGCIVGGHSIMKKRNVALVAAYRLISQGFSEYRARVVEELGTDKDRQFKYGHKQEIVTETVEGEDGKKKKVKTPINVADPNAHSIYARFFDESCPQWSKTPEYNQIFLKHQQNYANDSLHARGHLFLNEVYDLIGLPRTQAGSVVGWIMTPDGDNYVDFGMYDGEKERVRAFINGHERNILLDFNVDGVIYDLI